MKKQLGIPTLLALAPLLAIAQSIVVAENVPTAPAKSATVDPGMPRDVRTPAEPASQQSDFDKRFQARLRKDASLKGYAKSAKLVNQGGVVVLQGSVDSADALRRLERLAREVAGKRPFRSELRTSAQAR